DAVPSPDLVAGNTISWYLSTLGYFTETGIHILVQNPDETAAGSSYTNSVSVCTPTDFCAEDAITQTLFCSYDPNDKEVHPTGMGFYQYVPQSTELEFTVRFQNTGNWPATDVVLEDYISDALDISTLTVVGSSHLLTGINILPDGKAIFRFDGIMLPYADLDEQGSH